VPWKALLDLIEPHYPVAGRGRRPYPLESMLRVHLMQNWFALSDPAMDEALYEIASLRAFAHLSLGEPIPDETIIAARSSTKNQDGERDPEMHQTKKGNQWHFGMKAHIAVDAHSGLVHTVTTTAANESDVEQVAEPKGATQVWLPVPDLDTDWQRTVDNSWAGNASRAALVSDPARGVRMLHAEFAAGVTAPVLTLTSRVQTRNRAAAPDAGRVPAEDVATLRAYLGPTELQPVDGIVRKTALDATRGARTDEQKARALYEWVIANAHREPRTRGCGTGDIKAMLETGNLGGKCANLNALFVGLCRSVGIPARDVYGLRLAPSAFGYRELGGNSANLKGAQHCRAEVYLAGRGWLAMDPADVLKVMRQETPDWIKDPKHPLVSSVHARLFARSHRLSGGRRPVGCLRELRRALRDVSQYITMRACLPSSPTSTPRRWR
jgi:transglutaminase-like putative cysteine protease